MAVGAACVFDFVAVGGDLAAPEVPHPAIARQKHAAMMTRPLGIALNYASLARPDRAPRKNQCEYISIVGQPDEAKGTVRGGTIGT